MALGNYYSSRYSNSGTNKMYYYYDSSSSTQHYLTSRPMKVSFMGWESDTQTLQRHGWQLSMQVDHVRYGMRLALRETKTRLRGLSNFIPQEWLQDYDRHGIPTQIEFHLASDFVMHMHTPIDPREFVDVDANPRWEPYSRQELMSEWLPFRPIEKSKEIIIEEKSVSDMLDDIIKKQEESRMKILRDSVRDEKIQAKKFNAQIIQLVA